MIDTTRLPIRQAKEAYIFDYPAAAELAKKQRSIFWTAEEIPVENDKQDFLVNMTTAEQEAIKTTLKLFTIYELILGGEVWGDRIFHSFPRPEIQMMSNAFSFAELNMHAPFYAKLNQTLMIDTEDFYLSYKNDPVLEERVNFVYKAIEDEDLLYSLAVFTMMENIILYSNFAFIKHFQTNGKNMLANVVSGINFSARDENLHATGGAWLFNTCIDELRQHRVDENKIKELHDKIVVAAKYLYEHEARIVEMLFSHGEIDGIREKDLDNFVKSRVNMTLNNMNISSIYIVEENPIADWFYDSINGTQFHDLFQISGSDYSRNNNFDGAFEF